jgi:hypothetical protein
VFRTTHRRLVLQGLLTLVNVGLETGRSRVPLCHSICMQGSGGTCDSTHHENALALRQQQLLSKQERVRVKCIYTAQSAVVSAKAIARTRDCIIDIVTTKGEQLRQRRNSTSDRQKLEASTPDILENRISKSQLLVKIFEAHSKLLSELALESVQPKFRLPLSDEI